MNTAHQIRSESWEPPGGVLIWMLVGLEVLTFGAGILAFVYQERGNAVEFEQGRLLLDQTLAFANTLVLLTGGWFMACGLGALRKGKNTCARRWTLAALLAGVLFLLLKLVEYRQKAAHGIQFGEDTFFTLYYLLTGFHFVHVLVAVVLLGCLARSVRLGHSHAGDHQNFEAGGVFWHMCDLIWLLLYPVIYLL
ncbi:MAG TPA: cytochrome c oxidase subunit 3 [Prosthecobacter sp.]|nr:cytochrome c oxidase subunit 3 [Prosthecobacter sp.]